MTIPVETKDYQRLREIIAVFLETDPSRITADTRIDHTAIRGSVLIHRMYSALHSAGYDVGGKYTSKTFNELLIILGKEPVSPMTKEAIQTDLKNPTPDIDSVDGFSIGIDIEEISNMPSANDYREDVFYRQNFSQDEISYCIRQKDPRKHFAGMFAAKEAIIKADNYYKSIPFSEIGIAHHDSARPTFKNFILSVSHSEKQVVAVALKSNMEASDVKESKDTVANLERDRREKQFFKADTSLWISLLALLLSLVSITVALK
ncbi:MAG: 4'-phosphopantetheinyl transferase superfamily protein [Candidatus Omnitrophota bacterium]